MQRLLLMLGGLTAAAKADVTPIKTYDSYDIQNITCQSNITDQDAQNSSLSITMNTPLRPSDYVGFDACFHARVLDYISKIYDQINTTSNQSIDIACDIALFSYPPYSRSWSKETFHTTGRFEGDRTSLINQMSEAKNECSQEMNKGLGVGTVFGALYGTIALIICCAAIGYLCNQRKMKKNSELKSVTEEQPKSSEAIDLSVFSKNDNKDEIAIPSDEVRLILRA